MGTNYYLRKKAQYPCNDNNYCHNDSVQELTNGYVFKNTYYPSLDELNKIYYREYHIGKNSAGWHFLLGTYPNEGIKDLKDWELLFNQGQIYDEEDNLIDKEDMMNIIKNKPAFIIQSYTDVPFNIGKRNLLKHTDGEIIDNNTDGTYDIKNNSDFS